ncbi:uncharacterized protein LOC121381931 [Gigantopelta aegis]|uniref:uncharacterized protein LOC121381931 n=1 Tax=Gigantopelta aegis TaxID=1735272 RepID=UPI001B88BBF5|nr:uncharacterized protein LOC121381931 [Gigantopelta aegis]
MSRQRSSEKYTEQNGGKGFLATLKEFVDSVEGLKRVIMFPVRLQDMDRHQLPAMEERLQQFLEEGRTQTSQNDLYALYTLLLNAKSELLTGCDVAGREVVGKSFLGEHFAEVSETLRKMTDLSEFLKNNYETSLRLSD